MIIRVPAPALPRLRPALRLAGPARRRCPFVHCGHASGVAVWVPALISAVMAGWRRSLSTQRRRLGPMLPAGMPAGSDLRVRQRRILNERGEHLLAARGQLPERLPHRRVPFGCGQVLLSRRGVIVGMVLAVGAYPPSQGRRAARDVAAFAPVVVASQLGSAAGSRSRSRWSTSCSQTF
jgi:hypothetical protein